MKPHLFYILTSLAAADRHGSGIMRDVLELTSGELRLWPATLYGSLEELSERGWIREVADPERPAGESERKRFYRLTHVGRGALAEEAARLASVAAVARERLA